MNKVTRLELIHHEPCDTCHGDKTIEVAGTGIVQECPRCHGAGFEGREVIFNQYDGLVAEISEQDDGRTLKVFINKGENDG